MPLYPTEKIIWDENIVPTEYYSGEGMISSSVNAAIKKRSSAVLCLFCPRSLHMVLWHLPVS